MSNPQDEILKFRDDLIVTESPAKQQLIKDPRTGKVFAFSASAYRLLCLFDGARAVEDVVRSLPSFAQEPDKTRLNVRSVVQKARSAGFLESAEQAAAPPAVETAGSRAARGFNPFYVRFGVFDPSPFLGGAERLLRPLYSTAGVVALAILILASFAAIADARERYWNSFIVFGFFRWWLVSSGLVFLASLIHELGHVMACRRFGKQVREVGFLLYLLQPGCFADVTDATLLERRRERIIVSLGGVYFEGFVWGGLTLLWYVTRPFSTLNQIAFVTSVILLFRVLLNLVPFLRLDGYWILTDALGISNLRPKSFAFLLSVLPWVGFQWLRPPSVREKIIFASYGVVAVIFVVGTLPGALYALGLLLGDLVPSLAASVHWIVLAVALPLSVISTRHYIRGLRAAYAIQQ